MSERKRRINLLVVNVNKNIKVTWTCERWIKKCCKYEILKDTVMRNIQLQLFSAAIRKVILILQLFLYFKSNKFSHGEHKSSYDLIQHFKCSSRLHLFVKNYNKNDNSVKCFLQFKIAVYYFNVLKYYSLLWCKVVFSSFRQKNNIINYFSILLFLLSFEQITAASLSKRNFFKTP